MTNKSEDLADTLFELMENVAENEESIEAVKGDLEAFKKSLEEQLSALDRITGNVTQAHLSALQNLEAIQNSGILEKLDKKMMLKTEISRYQKIIIGILALVSVGAVAFFVLLARNIANGQNALMAFLGVMAVFIVALIVVYGNLRRVMMDEKIAPQGKSTGKKR